MRNRRKQLKPRRGISTQVVGGKRALLSEYRLENGWDILTLFWRGREEVMSMIWVEVMGLRLGKWPLGEAGNLQAVFAEKQGDSLCWQQE